MTELCCCEYLDHEGERNHILACCCNCRELDEGFEGLITGKGVSAQSKIGISKTFRDRMRIPWLGGAKRMTPDVVLPVVLIPSLFLFASVNLSCTIIAAFALLGCFLIVYKFCLGSMPRFFFMCNFVSIVTIYTIFQWIVVSFLLIQLEENIAASLALFIYVACMFKIKYEANKLKELPLNGDKASERVHYCQQCEVYSPEGSYHRFWVDSCIIPTSMKFYFIGLFSVLFSLLYTANLTLTSVCHPFRLIFTILLPDDCTEVYNMFELGLSFVSAIYSLLLATFILWEFLTFLKICLCGPHIGLCGKQRSCFRGVFFNCFRNVCCIWNKFKH